MSKRVKPARPPRTSHPVVAHDIRPAEPDSASQSPSPFSAYRPWLAALVVAFVTVLVFARVATHDFVNWDDNIHIYENPYFSPVTPAHLAHFWTTAYQGLYIPLGYMLFALLAVAARVRTPDPALSDTGALFDPHVFHAASVAFHGANAVLAFFLIRRLVRRDIPAAAGALLFALHPMQVESVAWASELRGLSSAFFSLLCLLLALPKPDAPESRLRQAGAVFCGTVALFCKPSAVVLPLAIVVLDRWFLGRSWKASVWVTAPLLALGVAFVGITQRVQHIPPQYLTPAWTRPFVAGDALAFYLGKLFAPIDLGIDYGRTPHWLIEQPWGFATWLVPAVLALAVFFVRRRAPWLVGGLLLSLVFLAPVLGLTPFVFQKFSTVADRYLYLALLGPALILAFGLNAAEGVPSARQVSRGIAILALGVLGVLSFRQAEVWRDSGTLMLNALNVNGKSVVAFSDYGSWLDKHGRTREAVAAYHAAIQLDPAYYEPHLNLGKDDRALGLMDESLTELHLAQSIKPAIAAPHFELGNVLDQMGREDAAIAEYREAIRLEPNVARVHNNLGIALQRQGKNADAIAEFEQAVLEDPTLFAAHANLGTLLMGAGRDAEALAQFRAAIALQPGSAILHALAGNALAAQGDVPSATGEYQAALRLDPICGPAQAGLRRLQTPSAK